MSDKKNYTLAEARKDITGNKSKVRAVYLVFGHGENSYHTVGLECFKVGPRGDVTPYALIYRSLSGHMAVNTYPDSCITERTLIDFVLPAMGTFDQLLIASDALERGWQP